ncbi:hypothetical protein Tco_0273948 [Tanacetum coccineum]
MRRRRSTQLLPTLQAVALPAVDHAPSTEETAPPTPFSSDTEVARLLAIPTLPPSPLSPWSSPLPQIPSPPLPVSPPPPASPTYPLGYQAAMIRLRAEAPFYFHSSNRYISTAHNHEQYTSIRDSNHSYIYRYPTSSPSFAGLPPLQTRRGTGPRGDFYHLGKVEAMQGTPVVTDVVEFCQRMTDFKTRVRQDTDEIYTRLDDEQSERQLMASRLNILYRDRHAHACTARLMETEARMSREAWGRSMDASDLARAEVMSLRTQVVANQAVITKLQVADRRRQVVITEMLVADRRRQKQFIEALKLPKRLQTQMTKFERQQGPAKGLAQPDAPEEAGSSS